MYYVVTGPRDRSLFAGSYDQCVEYLKSRVNRSALWDCNIKSAVTGRYVSWSF